MDALNSTSKASGLNVLAPEWFLTSGCQRVITVSSGSSPESTKLENNPEDRVSALTHVLEHEECHGAVGSIPFPGLNFWDLRHKIRRHLKTSGKHPHYYARLAL